jgi:hypothetical protein
MAEPSWDFERPVCGGRAEPGNSGWCTGTVSISPPVYVAADGDDSVAPGELLKVTFTTALASEDPVPYPCLGVAVADEAARLPLGPDGIAIDNPIFSGSFALVSDSTLDYEFHVAFADTLQPGTRVSFLAWGDSLNTGCEDGGELEFEIPIE